MNPTNTLRFLCCFCASMFPLVSKAHVGPHEENHARPHPTAALDVPLIALAQTQQNSATAETKTPVRPATTGQGDWVFRLADQYQLPPAALEKIGGAHGGFAVDPTTNDLYFGLKGVGLIRIGPRPGDAEVLEGFPQLAEGNLHNVTLFTQGNERWISCPDNEGHKVHLLNLDTRRVKVLSSPQANDYYRKGGAFNPTDTALGGDILFVADGYSPGNFILTADPFEAVWLDLVFGGSGTAHGQFTTAHGITFNPQTESMDIADRPRGRIQRHSFKGEYVDSIKLPDGSWPADVSFHNGFAVVGCLFGPGQSTPAPIYILDDRGRIVSRLKPKEDLGIEQAVHLHDAAWWIHRGAEGGEKVMIAVTPWNPGGFFVLEQVKP